MTVPSIQLFIRSRGVPCTDLMKALKELSQDELEIGIERGDADSMYELGRRFYEGDGVEQDYSRAVPLIKASAQAGNPAAQCTFGYMCC